MKVEDGGTLSPAGGFALEPGVRSLFVGTGRVLLKNRRTPMDITTDDYEKLGSFYLGREYDLKQKEMQTTSCSTIRRISSPTAWFWA